MIKRETKKMGMYDSVIVYCPNCATANEFQSKAGDCLLNEYSLSDAPPEILLDLKGKIQICQNCKKLIGIVVQAIVYAQAHIAKLPEGTEKG